MAEPSKHGHAQQDNAERQHMGESNQPGGVNATNLATPISKNRVCVV